MAEWNRTCGGVLRAAFTDTITIYQKNIDETWNRIVVRGIQWSEKTERLNNNGKISVQKYVSITFPEGTYEGIPWNSAHDEDAIVLGDIKDVVTTEKGNRISDLLKRYQQSGIIKSVNDNSNRDRLKNIKVVLA